MKPFALFPLVALVLAAQSLPSHAQNAPDKPFFFRDGDRAMLTGDSITAQRRYSTLIESFVLSR
ncbi:MAG: hypothetical protein KY445_08575, partial [Armatimonadetes bacterium]|nr:hypothetical protein [Armatimonadota bacterium]